MRERTLAYSTSHLIHYARFASDHAVASNHSLNSVPPVVSSAANHAPCVPAQMYSSDSSSERDVRNHPYLARSDEYDGESTGLKMFGSPRYECLNVDSDVNSSRHENME